MSADYSAYPPEGITPTSDQYAVTIDGVEFPTSQINDLDGEAIIFGVYVGGIDAFRPITTSAPVEVTTPEETFTGSVAVAIEHGDLTVHVDRVEEEGAE